MAKLPFALKEGHPLKDDPYAWIVKCVTWYEVDAGVWGITYPASEGKGYGVVLVSRDCGVNFLVSGSNGALEAIRQARRIREDQHEADVARATGEAE